MDTMSAPSRWYNDDDHDECTNHMLHIRPPSGAVHVLRGDREEPLLPRRHGEAHLRVSLFPPPPHDDLVRA